MKGYFITGTDTGVGKTCVALGLMAALKKSSLKVLGMKPVASGSLATNVGLRNEDARQLQLQGYIKFPYEQVNPYAFEPAVAPHLAAAEAGVRIDLTKIKNCYEALARSADVVVVEGVGGWKVPLSENQTVSDLALVLNLPVILVIGLRLGCINHALLTAEAIKSKGLHLQAWVANQQEPAYPTLMQTIDCLSARLGAPMLGHIPCLPTANPEAMAIRLDLEQLTK